MTHTNRIRASQVPSLDYSRRTTDLNGGKRNRGWGFFPLSDGWIAGWLVGLAAL